MLIFRPLTLKILQNMRPRFTRAMYFLFLQKKNLNNLPSPVTRQVWFRHQILGVRGWGGGEVFAENSMLCY